MIILEGVDNTGKTTLAKYLSRELELPVEKLNTTDTSIGFHIRHRMQMESRGILDRVQCISEMVYGRNLRSNSRVTAEMVRQLYDLQPIIIFCRPSNDTILDNGERYQMPGVVENHLELIEFYDGVIRDYEQAGFKVFHYNWKNPNSKPAALKACHEHLETKKHLKVLEALCSFKK